MKFKVFDSVGRGYQESKVVERTLGKEISWQVNRVIQDVCGIVNSSGKESNQHVTVELTADLSEAEIAVANFAIEQDLGLTVSDNGSVYRDDDIDFNDYQ